MEHPHLNNHFAKMAEGGYVRNPAKFARLHAWNRILFQVNCASEAIEKLIAHKPQLGSKDNFNASFALLNTFILQYGKCFSSAGQGLVTLDAKKVFPITHELLPIHKRIMNIRNTFIAHNDLSEFVLTTMSVKEEEDRFIVRHHITLSLPSNEYIQWKAALAELSNHVVLRLNKHLDSLQEELGKIIVLDDS